MARSAVVERSALAVDPRISQRRAEVRRDRGRRWLRRVAWLGGAVAVPALLFAVTRSPALDVDRIEVGGARRTGVLPVVDASGIDHGAPMTDLDLEAAARSVEELAWVDDAVLDRDWPGTVRIVLTERSPVAAAALDGRWALVDDGGRVLEVRSGHGHLPVLEGMPEVPAPGGSLGPDAADVLAVATALPGDLARDVVAVTVEDDGVHLTWRPGGDVLLGSARTLTGEGGKIEALATMRERVDLTCMETLDLRVPSAPVLTRDPACG